MTRNRGHFRLGVAMLTASLAVPPIAFFCVAELVDFVSSACGAVKTIDALSYGFLAALVSLVVMVTLTVVAFLWQPPAKR